MFVWIFNVAAVTHIEKQCISTFKNVENGHFNLHARFRLGI